MTAPSPPRGMAASTLLASILILISDHYELIGRRPSGAASPGAFDSLGAHGEFHARRVANDQGPSGGPIRDHHIVDHLRR